jgi:hypothetical protein
MRPPIFLQEKRARRLSFTSDAPARLNYDKRVLAIIDYDRCAPACFDYDNCARPRCLTTNALAYFNLQNPRPPPPILHSPQAPSPSLTRSTDFSSDHCICRLIFASADMPLAETLLPPQLLTIHCFFFFFLQKRHWTKTQKITVTCVHPLAI